MAARRKKNTKSRRSASSGGWAGKVFLALLFLAAGLAGGYCWRSYAPLALPFESPLVSDASSADMSNSAMESIAEKATAKARSAEEELARLRKRIADLEAAQLAAERELADMKIKNVLQAGTN